jgi:hypothetical protein
MIKIKTKYSNPKQWTLIKIVSKIKSIKEYLTVTPKYSKQWFVLQFKREITQIKKHVVLWESLINLLEKSDDPELMRELARATSPYMDKRGFNNPKFQRPVNSYAIKNNKKYLKYENSNGKTKSRIS